MWPSSVPESGGYPPIGAAVLVGGGGRRLSPLKPLLPVAGKPIVDRVIEAVWHVAAEIVLVTHRPGSYAHLGLPIIPDVRADCGPLGGIWTALRSSAAEHVLIVAGDLPFLQPALLRHLASRVRNADCVIPEWQGHLQPLHGIYRVACEPTVARMVTDGNLCPLDLYPQVRTAVIPASDVAMLDPTGLSFFNVNTPADLAQAQRLAASLGVAERPPGASDRHGDLTPEVALHEAR